MTTVRLLVVALGATLLVGCSDGGPTDRRRADVAALTQAANDGDAAAVRERADELLRTVEVQRGREQLTADQAERLVALAQSVRARADLLDTALQERLLREQAEAELEEERKRLEEARQQLEQERKEAEDEPGKGKGKDDDEKDDD